MKYTIVVILLFLGRVLASEITVCAVNLNAKNNPTYYQLPNTNSQLICELPGKQSQQTLLTMYAQGWHLIEVVKVDSRYTLKNNTAPSPVLYFER